MTLSKLTLGTAQLGMPYGVANRSGQPDQRAAFGILSLALELGVRSFDTAPAYGDAEARLGAFFAGHGRPDDVVVTTKLPALEGEHDVRGAVTRAVDASRARLGRIDCYLIHSAADLRRHGDTLVDSLLGADLPCVGLSIYQPADAELMLRWPALQAIQFPLNLLDRRMITSGLLAQLRSRGVTTFARSAFLQGLFALAPAALPARVARARKPLEALRAALGEWSPLDAALPFALAAGADSVVIGVESEAQLRENVTRAGRALPGGLADRIADAVGVVEESILDPSQWPNA